MVGCLSIFLLISFTFTKKMDAQKLRPREYGIPFGILPPGDKNAIQDVSGVLVGHITLDNGDQIHTGVTSILPHGRNLFKEKVPAAVYIGNGFGKLAGFSQVKELGNLETPILLTNTLQVSTAMEAIITHTISQNGNEKIGSVNAVVGETNDGALNDIRGRHLLVSHFLDAIKKADNNLILEGNVGAGTGTVSFGFKGGIGTSSRKIPKSLGGYTVGVITQTNFGGVLTISGVPVGQELGKYYLQEALAKSDGSCMIVVATDAPVDARNLERLAKRALFGLARTGGIASNGSGDYVIAFSTGKGPLLDNEAMSPLFLGVIEATEEAIINSLFAANTMKNGDRIIPELPIQEVLPIMKKYNRLQPVKK
ncbi:MAG: S58 family peptidase [Bacteroidetes bacterium]|nr:S58 family peptidase [Bacteroidota bacterium]